MKNNTIFTLAFLLISTFSFSQYTLQDADVVVTNGVIMSCSITNFDTASYSSGNIIIPLILDGDTVKGIANKTLSTGVFAYKSISSVTLPSSITSIGNYAFCYNIISNLNISASTYLQHIGNQVFFNNSLTNINLSTCTDLISIGDKAFYNNSISSLNLSNCTTLQTIGEYAFYNNSISSLNLSACTSLLSIGVSAFNNNSLSSFNLPINNQYSSFNWEDVNGVTHIGGAIVTNLTSNYFIHIPYTLQDNDVVVTNGIITNCSITNFNTSSYSNGSIIIPTILDGDTIIGVADGLSGITGVFYNKNIKSLRLPSSLLYIGNYTFRSNNISTLNLSNCTALLSIGISAFSNNSILSLNLSSCTSLRAIGEYAFFNNSFSSFNLPINTQYPTYNWEDDNGSTYIGGANITDMNSYYYIPVPYTLQDNDVFVTNGQIISCSITDFNIPTYYFGNIIIPQILDGDTVKGIADAEYSSLGAFYNRGINTITLPSSLQYIGNYSFSHNSISSLDLSNCNTLQYIGNNAFFVNSISSLDLSNCNTLQYIGDNAFRSNNISSLNLSNCNTLQYIGDEAFYSNSISSLNLNNCNDLEYIGNNAFNHNSISNLNLSSCIALQDIGNKAFNNNSISSLNLSSCIALQDIGVKAFNNNSISSLDLSSCIALQDIGNNAFSNNSISSLDLSGCTSLLSIGKQAFAVNSIPNIDLSNCHNLQAIGISAFNNNSISSFNLPINTQYSSYNWIDSIGGTYIGGANITNLSYYYYIPISYTLQDDDVVVTNEQIISCSITDFNIAKYLYGNIIIPQILDGDTLKGIANETDIGYGIFSNKNISSITLPSSIQHIGNNAFYNNFISSLDLSNCPNIQYIGGNAFTSNSISFLDLSNCNNLEYIGEYAFAYDNISSLDLSSCNNLKYIGAEAFKFNNISSFNLPINSQYSSYNWEDMNGVTHIGGANITNFSSYYYIPYTYTLQDDDVVVQNSEIISCSYNFAFKKIIIPQILDGDTIRAIGDGITPIYGIFKNKGIITIMLPSSLEHIGYEAFFINNISSLDLSNCNNLLYIGVSAFSNNYISSLNLTNCNNLQHISTWAFSSNSISSLDLSNCSNLQYIGYYSFSYNNISSLDLSNCTALQYIGDNAFKNNSFSNFNLPTPIIPAYIFNNWEDGNNTTFSGGDTITDLTTSYTANLTNTGQEVSFTILDVITNTGIQNVVIDLGIYGIRTSNENGIAIFESVNDTTNIPYTVSKNGNYINGIITIAGSAISETIFLCESAYNTTDTLAICESDLPYSYNGEVIPIGTPSGNISFTYTSVLTGCDSIFTINLNFNSNTGTDIQTACNNYTWIDGITYTTNNNTATHTLTNSNGCDSVVTLNLTINSNSGTDTITACDSYSWIDGVTYTASNNTVTHTLTNIAGCDSVVTLNLTINPSPIVSCPQDINITSSDILNLNAATPQGGVYSGVGVSNNQFNPAGIANGAYTITYTYIDPITLCQDYCEFDINLGTIGIKDINSDINCSIYPNPTSDACTLSLTLEESQEVIIRLINNLGQQLERRKLNSSKEFNETFDFSGMAPGVYSILINVGDKQITKRVILK